MALDRISPRQAPQWGIRIVEWGILAIVMLILAGVFGHYARQVQGQSERASILSTLGALRTALVLNNVHQSVASKQRSRANANTNPFDTLERLPANYGGIVHDREVNAVTPGRWVFDPECPCVGYRPMDPEWLEAPPGTQMLWYLVVQEAGIDQLHPMADYKWQGLDIR